MENSSEHHFDPKTWSISRKLDGNAGLNRNVPVREDRMEWGRNKNFYPCNYH